MVAVLIVIALVVIVAFAALVIDVGNGRQEKRQVQAAADAGALAGAGYLAEHNATCTSDAGGAQSAAATFADANLSNSVAPTTACPPPPGSGTYAGNDNCVYVKLHKPLDGLFSAGTNPTAHAAACSFAGAAQCGFCVLGKDGYSGQNGTLTVTGAAVAIDGTPSFGPQGTINAPAGTTLYDGGSYSGSSITPTPTTTGAPLADPLAQIAVPSFTGLTGQSGCAAGGHAIPGIYTQIPTCGALDPGLYVITGSTHISGNSTIDAASGVTLYLTCGSSTVPRPCNSTGEAGADLICTGNATFKITAPSTGPTAHMAIFFDRHNTSGLDCRGNGAGAVNGTVYGESASLTMRGNGTGCATADFNALVVINSINFNGSPSSFCANYNAAQNVPEPSIQLVQ